MRAFQLMDLILFLIFYILISLGAIISLTNIGSSYSKKWIYSIVSSSTVFSIISFIFLYVWPNSARSAGDYSPYLIYNAFLSIDFIFKIPLTFSLVFGFLFKKTKRSVIYFIGFIISVCLSSSVIYGSFFGKNEFVVNHIELEFTNLPMGFDNYEILQISDIHLGSFIHSNYLLNKVMKKVEEINPSLLLFTGDLINNFSNELIGWEEIFNNINKDRISYSILGNHDYGNYTDWKSDELKRKNFEKIIASHDFYGFQLLRNESVKLTLGNDSIYIIGVENWGHPPFPQYANLEKAISKVPVDAFKILMTHDPAHWESVVKYRKDIDLSLSGHTHGMQWGILKAGIPFSLSYLVRKNWAGLYISGNSKLYVNTGLGIVGVPWRINMPGELTVIKLKRIKVD